jgi:TonB family protein
MNRLAGSVLLVASLACGRNDAPPRAAIARDPGPRPDEMPALVNTELPFRYPPALYTKKAQGNVTLRLFIDRDGKVAPESTRVDEASGIPELDSAAATGAASLRFIPAKLNGEPVPVTILFPVYFRHPEARPLPGDSVLPTTPRAPDGA